MRIVRADRLIASMGVSPSVAATANAESALEMATSALEALLDTPLSRATRTDFYNIDCLSRKIYPTLSLTGGFVDDASVILKSSANSLPLKTAADGEVITPNDYIIKNKEGLINLLYSTYCGVSALSVTYTSGFASDIADPDVLIGVPTWMENAAITAATMVLNSHPSNQANKKSGLTTIMLKQLEALLYRTISPYFRTRVGVLWPTRTV